MYACNQKVAADGRRRVDLIDRFGNTTRSAYVMSGVGLPLNVPPAQEMNPKDYKSYPKVVVGMTEGDSLPIVLGALDTPEVSYTSQTDTNTGYEQNALFGPKLSNDADVDTDVNYRSMEEAVLAAPNGGRFILKRNGHAVIAGVGVSVQVPEGSYMRISAGGDTEGRVPLVDPLVERLNDMTDTINDLQDEVRELRLLLSTQVSVTHRMVNLVPMPNPAAPTGPPLHVLVSVDPLAPVLAATATALIEPVSIDVGASTSTPLAPLDSLTIASATLRVGSATEV
jgi:hypothetical protein